MALRITGNKAAQENAIGIGKAKTTTTTGLTRRPALGEISNVQSRQATNLNKDGAEKKEIKKKPIVFQKQTGIIASRQTTSRLTQQTTQSLICKTTTLLKPSRAVIKPPTSTTTAAVGPPSVLPKLRSRPPLQKTASTHSLVPKSAYSSLRIEAPVVPEDCTFHDIDKEHSSNPILLGEYAPEIFAFMREIEKKYVVKDDFLKGQQINAKMRAIVVDWLVDVQLQYSLLIETLHLAIGIFDRFLEKNKTITRQKLQLVGVTSMWIACKYEELFSPELENFVYITDRAYTKSEIMKMEQLIHKTLDFCYGQPLSIHFLRRYSNASKADSKQHVYAKYFLELALVSYPLRSVRPSLLAAAALYISFCIAAENTDPGSEIWSESLTFYSTYSFDDIKPHIPVLAQYILDTQTLKLQAIPRKYSASKQQKVSTHIQLKTDILEALVGLADEESENGSSSTKTH